MLKNMFILLVFFDLMIMPSSLFADNSITLVAPNFGRQSTLIANSIATELEKALKKPVIAKFMPYARLIEELRKGRGDIATLIAHPDIDEVTITIQPAFYYLDFGIYSVAGKPLTAADLEAKPGIGDLRIGLINGVSPVLQKWLEKEKQEGRPKRINPVVNNSFSSILDMLFLGRVDGAFMLNVPFAAENIKAKRSPASYGPVIPLFSTPVNLKLSKASVHNNPEMIEQMTKVIEDLKIRKVGEILKEKLLAEWK
ncbi:MAG: hypothetical protein ACOVS5_06830 [Oligoflexus sp.]|jgi:ABC-type amino acid transport substrate-binding protein